MRAPSRDYFRVLRAHQQPHLPCVQLQPFPSFDLDSDALTAPPRNTLNCSRPRDVTENFCASGSERVFAAPGCDERRSLRRDTRMTPDGAVTPALAASGRGGSTLATDGSVLENQRGDNRRGEHRFFSAMAATPVEQEARATKEERRGKIPGHARGVNSQKLKVEREMPGQPPRG